MRLPTLIRTSVFQLTLVYMALFAASAIALFAFVYWSTLGYLERQTNAVIEAEIDGLAEQYERRSLRGLAEVITERVNRDSEGRSIYLLAEPNGAAIAGNLPYWPRELEGPLEWVDFQKLDDAGQAIPVRGRVLRVGLGFRLLVGDHAIQLPLFKRRLVDLAARYSNPKNTSADQATFVVKSGKASGNESTRRRSARSIHRIAHWIVDESGHGSGCLGACGCSSRVLWSLEGGFRAFARLVAACNRIRCHRDRCLAAWASPARG
jgi:hypothetical protein